MKRISMIVLSAAMTMALMPLAGSAQDNPLAMDAFILHPPASAAPSGNWSFVQPYGYLWIPEAASGIMEAEWAPWDPWWAMPYGRWAWADGCGWGWTPMIPSWDMSPLGWGYDSWYGGWYGFTPDGNPAGIGCTTGIGFGGRGWSAYDDKLAAQAWMNRHGGQRSTEPSRVKVVAVVAKPPVTLNPILPMREDRDRVEPGRGHGGYERPSVRQHPRNGADRTEPARTGGGHHGNGQGGGGQVSKPPTSGGQSGGSYTSPRTGGGSGKPRH
jgi:hypothetical protein